ncbi:MAG: acyl-CoA thioesterase [Crocinitomicaceae bacterium]|jgi:acyl-CoA thioester hydrolase|nr:acyl-CoA thioesterase [Crocinitomicaceae bacterium]
MEINFSQKTSLRVRYGETDQMGYCYYGNYAQYFEVGRVEALRSFGMSYKQMEEAGVMLPVSEFNVRYFAPAYYDDLLLIKTKIVGMKGPRLFFEYEVENEVGKVISIATTTLVFVAKETMRPISPPDDFYQLMLQHEVK